MSRIFFLSWVIAAGLAVASLSAQVPATAPATIKWSDNFQAALAQAAHDHKLILLNFTGSDWCTACAALDRKVFRSPEFAAWAREKCVLLEVDFPNAKKLPDTIVKQNAALKKTYMALGYPTIAIVDPEGKMLAWTAGYWGQTPAEWIAAREQDIAEGRKALAKRQAMLAPAKP